ncbi:MAG: rod shape-determining protein MreD [Eubacterium sp.]|jgi:rod shape-determining protein MreD|nr:rod shape-determining protein MreD [Eubacterium sp.]
MRGKIILYTILIFILVTTQVTFLNFIEIFGVRPNLIIILIVSIALLEGRSHGAAVGFFAGLCLDAVVGVALGYHALIGMLLGVLLGNINRRFFKENMIVMIICTFISTFFYESAVVVVSYTLGLKINFLETAKAVILPEAALNSIFGVIVFFLIVRINRKLSSLDVKNKY